MKPYQILQKQKSVIERMKQGVKYSKNKHADIANLNAIIDTTNCLEKSLSNTLRTDIVDRLMYALMYEFMLKREVYEGKDIPLKEAILNVRNALQEGYSKEMLISVLKTHEMVNLKDFSTHDFVNFEPMVEDLVETIKLEI